MHQAKRENKELRRTSEVLKTSSAFSHGASQYASIQYRERHTEAGKEPSADSKDDYCENALTESINGLYQVELIHRRGPRKTREAVELATLEWVSCSSHQLLKRSLGFISPAEAEEDYYRQHHGQATAAVRLKPDSLRNTRGGSNLLFNNRTRISIMKPERKYYLGLLLAPIIAFGLSGCSSDDAPLLQVDDSGNTSVNLDTLSNELEALPAGELSNIEEEGLLYMREEEKLARDVYLYLYEVWNRRVFSNISESEQTHMDAMLVLIERYNLTDPAAGNAAGVFLHAELQALYDDLVAQGEASLIDALQVGALIEEVDLIDIARYIADVDANEDIVLVYENLMKGSRNHLRAFVRNLETQGVEYEPLYLDQAEYESIINSPIEH